MYIYLSSNTQLYSPPIDLSIIQCNTVKLQKQDRLRVSNRGGALRRSYKKHKKAHNIV